MKNKLVKTLILSICLLCSQKVFADTEEEVLVVTNVAYTASLTKKSSNESATVNPVTGVHPGLSSVFTLQTNGGDDHFDYIITSYIDTLGGRVSAYGDDGRLLFAHESARPTLAAVNNAKYGTSPSKNVMAYPTTVSATNGMTSSFYQSYKDYGPCYVILTHNADTGNITHSVSGTPSASTYELGVDQSGNYKSVVVFTITSK